MKTIRKFTIGDRIGTSEWGRGEIIAMTKTWCIFVSDFDKSEIAVLWADGVWLEVDAERPGCPQGSLLYLEIP
jgi:hypothetical protein